MPRAETPRLGTRSLSLAVAIGLLVVVVALALLAQRRQDRDRLMRADPEMILHDPKLAPIALAMGRTGFAAHCAACHGNGTSDRDGIGDPRRGIPDLTDNDYLYGEGQVAQIETIILHGIRAGDSQGWDLASMPAFARAKPYDREALPSLSPAQIGDITQYLLSMHNRATDASGAVRGKALFKAGGACWDCHGGDGGGDAAIGAPNLVDDVWLYGDGSAASIFRSIAYGHAGRSPAFAKVLPAVEARAIAVYVSSLSHDQAGRASK